MTLSFFVSGIPVPKGRPRTFRTKTGKTITTTPPRTRRWEHVVRMTAHMAVMKAGWKPEAGSYAVEVVVYRARRAGDADNFGKAVTDAMNEVVYPDDSCIGKLTVSVVDGASPGVLVRVERG